MSELDRHREALLAREDALLRCEQLPPDLDLQRRTNPLLSRLEAAELVTVEWRAGPVAGAGGTTS